MTGAMAYAETNGATDRFSPVTKEEANLVARARAGDPARRPSQVSHNALPVCGRSATVWLLQHGS
jgi:hypothetical protein